MRRNLEVTEYSETVDTAKSYMAQPYARIIIPELDGSFRGEVMEFPGCIALGDTPSEALQNLEEVAVDWVVSALERNQSIPPPLDGNSEFSGKLMLRIPKSLHKKATWYADREGVSLNQFIVYSLSMAVGERRNMGGVSLVVFNRLASTSARQQAALQYQSTAYMPYFATPEPLRLIQDA